MYRGVRRRQTAVNTTGVVRQVALVTAASPSVENSTTRCVTFLSAVGIIVFSPFDLWRAAFRRRTNNCLTCLALLRHLASLASPAMGHWGTCPSTSDNFSFSSLWSKSDSQLSKYFVVCEISWCRCQQLAAPWPNFQLCPSSQQILATPLFSVTDNVLHFVQSGPRRGQWGDARPQTHIHAVSDLTAHSSTAGVPITTLPPGGLSLQALFCISNGLKLLPLRLGYHVSKVYIYRPAKLASLAYIYTLMSVQDRWPYCKTFLRSDGPVVVKLHA